MENAVIVPEDGAHQFCPSRTHQSGKTHDLAGADMEIGVFTDHSARDIGILHTPVGYLKDNLTGVGLMGRIAVLDGAAYHGTDDPVLIHMTCFHRVGLHGASVSNDGNGIRDRRDFIEFVGDHDTGDALALQAPHQLQKIGRIRLIQSRGGFIQNQQLDILGQCLCDFHQLLLAHTQIFNQGIGVQIQTHTLHQVHGPPTGFLPVNEAVLYDLIAHKNILGNGKLGDHGQLLMDDDDSGVFRFLDVFELGFFSHVENLALVRTVWVDTGQDFHQGGFSGAVFAADRMDFTPPHFQRYAVQCANARKLLDDFPHLEND